MATMGWSPESVPTPGESNSSGTINESELKRAKNNTMMAEVAPTRAATAVIARELFKEKDNMQTPEKACNELSQRSPDQFYIGEETGPLSVVSTSDDVEIAEADEVYEILKASLAKREAADLADQAKAMQEIKAKNEQQSS